MNLIRVLLSGMFVPTGFIAGCIYAGYIAGFEYVVGKFMEKS